ncbi:putative ORfan [Saudi moumouvirus]|nr:putative ORfan [Saudi moumouvirus]
MYCTLGLLTKQFLYNFKIPIMLIYTKISCYSVYFYAQNIEKGNIIGEYYCNYDY